MKKILPSLLACVFVSTSYAADLAIFDFENASARFEDSLSVLNVSDLTAAAVQTDNNFFSGTAGGEHTPLLSTLNSTTDVTWTTVGLAGEEVTYESLIGDFGLYLNRAIVPSLSYTIGAGTVVAAGTGTFAGANVFDQQTFDFADFSTDEAVSWTLTFTKTGGGNNQEVLRFDNLTVTGTIPEPSTTAMLIGFGALGIVVLRRRA